MRHGSIQRSPFRRAQPELDIGPRSIVRGSASVAVFRAAEVVLILGVAVLISRGHWIVAAGFLLIVWLGVVGLLADAQLVWILATAVLLQVPLGNVGPIPSLQLVELVVPLLLFAFVVRRHLTHERVSVAKPILQTWGPARAIHLPVALFATVVVMNFIRSKYLLPEVIPAGVNRAFYGYGVALGVYYLIYKTLASGTVAFPTLFRFLFRMSVLLSGVGVGAVLLNLPLNFGSLRYSVYDYATGGVRVGFLETFGTVGLALVCVGTVRHRLLAGFLFAAALVTSGGRATAVGVAVAIVLYLSVTRRGLWLIALAGVILGLAFAMPTLQRHAQVQRLTDINSKSFEADGRKFIYEKSYAAFRAHPLFGTGVGVPIVVPTPDPALSAFYEAQLSVGGHGTYAALMKNFGLSGLLPFTAILVAALWRLGRLARSSNSAGFFFIALATQAVASIAGGNGSDPFFFFVLAGAAAVVASASRSQVTSVAAGDGVNRMPAAWREAGSRRSAQSSVET